MTIIRRVSSPVLLNHPSLWPVLQQVDTTVRAQACSRRNATRVCTMVGGPSRSVAQQNTGAWSVMQSGEDGGDGGDGDDAAENPINLRE